MEIMNKKIICFLIVGLYLLNTITSQVVTQSELENSIINVYEEMNDKFLKKADAKKILGLGYAIYFQYLFIDLLLVGVIVWIIFFLKYKNVKIKKKNKQIFTTKEEEENYKETIKEMS